MQRQFKNEFFTPKLQETLKVLGLDPNKETDFDGIIATSMILNDALWQVHDEIDSQSEVSTTTEMLESEIQKREGVAQILKNYVRTTLEILGRVETPTDVATMILVRKKPQYELVKSLLEK
jgi:2-hydroxy-3-keto-5-methylthiopentenyl-1-phosphate phosphatase